MKYVFKVVKFYFKVVKFCFKVFKFGFKVVNVDKFLSNAGVCFLW